MFLFGSSLVGRFQPRHKEEEEVNHLPAAAPTIAQTRTVARPQRGDFADSYQARHI